MSKTASPRRLCSNLTGICSKVTVMPKSLMERRQFIAGAGAAAVSGLACSHSAAQSSPPRTLPTPLVRPADIVLKNGKVLAVDGTFTIAQAIAITADKIIAVGANDAMTAHISAQTRI